MDIRRHFTVAATTAAYEFLKNIRTLATQPVVTTALANAPAQLVRNRHLDEIFLDDMMDSFAALMANVHNKKLIPHSLYHWMKISRNGPDITQEESNEEMFARIESFRSGQKKPKSVPDFMNAIADVTPGPSLATFANNWQRVLSHMTYLTSSDDTLMVMNSHETQMHSMAAAINGIMQARQSGGKTPATTDGALTKPSRPGQQTDDEADDLDEVVQKINKINIPDKTREEIARLIRQTKRLNPQSSEFSINMKRLELIASLPWGTYNQTNGNITLAQEILDKDHYGLEKVKTKVIQHIAVQNRAAVPSGKILLLVGPPGVGKTSIAQSIAEATGREYIRVALGGVHKESDIRGHSSTFVGAMPGRIIQEIRKAKSSNPLIVLDEIDKLGHGSTNGDPGAALLEVLDPAQNHTFRDDFMGLEFDLSKVMFLCTANDLSTIPGPLRDRMHVISLPGYTQDEKLEIATRYLLPKQMKVAALEKSDLVIEQDAIKTLIENYTAEAGVRTLEKKISDVCSKAVVDIATGKKTGQTIVTPDDLEDYVGPAYGGRDHIPEQDSIGVVNGLAYSSAGGSILQIEACLAPSQGFRMVTSGNLGKVMGESAGVAESLVRSRAPEFGISDALLRQTELRIHAPEGAVPKDGPSAGAAFTTAIISALTKIPVRRDVAMTGEINLRGEVTAIGGLPEKLEGALRAGATTVLIPRQNVPHLAEVSDKIKSKLTIVPVSTIEDVLKNALTRNVEPLVTAKKSWGSRLRDAWAVVMNPSNDTGPAPSRQAAGSHFKTPSPL